MCCRLLLFLLSWMLPVLALAQAPGTVTRHDIDGDYPRPDLNAPLFDPLQVLLDTSTVAALVRDLDTIARNFPDHPGVNHALRAHALSVALRLHPEDHSCLIANGQLARGVTPAPLTTLPPPTPGDVAGRLMRTARELQDAAQNDAQVLARLLYDIAGRLDPYLLPDIMPLTYGATPPWPGPRVDSLAAAAVVELKLRNAGARVLLPGLQDGQLRILTVQAEAVPSPGHAGIRLSLPAPLQRAMQEKDRQPLREEVQRRADGLRAMLERRHEAWPDGWLVQITVPDASALDLPPLFAGAAIAMDALLSGHPPDPQCILAAGLTADGKLAPAMTVEQLLPAAALQQTTRLLILPDEMDGPLSDWLYLTPSQWPLLYHITLHRAPSIGDAMALSRSVRAPKLEQSISRFNEVAARLRSSGNPLAELRRPETTAALEEVVAWHPHHLSASALLSVTTGGPATLTPGGSLRHIDNLARAALSTDRRRYPLHIPPPRFKKSEFGEAMDALKAAQRQLHPSVRSYASEVELLAKMLDRTKGRWKAYLNKGPIEPPEISRQRSAAASLRTLLDAQIK